MEDRIPSKRLTAWILAACPALFLSAFGANWWLCLMIVVIIGIFTTIWLTRCPQEIALPIPVCVAEVLWAGVLSGILGNCCAQSWPEGEISKAVPVILLLLSALAAQRGNERLSATTAVTMWFVLGAAGLVLALGTSEMNAQYLQEEPVLPEGTFLVGLLLPCAAILLPGRKEKHLPAATGAVAVICTVSMTAVLSADVIQTSPAPFYTFAQCVRPGGESWRLEPITSCVLTLSWFSLFGLLMGTAHSCGEKMRPAFGKGMVWLCFAVAVIVLSVPVQISAVFTVMGSLLFWVILPIVLCGMQTKKRFEKM